jgi:hypothetical protein
MTTITNVSGQGLSVPAVGAVVDAGQQVDVPDDLAEGLLAQSDVWAPTKPAKPAATKGKS